MDAFHIKAAFAAQTLGCVRRLGWTVEKVNLRGCAIALGYPLGASEARVLVSLLHVLEDARLRRAIASLCIAGGLGIAVAIKL